VGADLRHHRFAALAYFLAGIGQFFTGSVSYFANFLPSLGRRVFQIVANSISRLAQAIF